MSVPAAPATPSAQAPPRRVVAAVNDDGKSVIKYDDRCGVITVPAPEGQGDVWPKVWAAESTPADARADGDGASLEAPGVVMPNGSMFKVIDIGPGASFPLHFTHSIDYCYIASGTLTMGLSDGSSTLLHAGDTLVQLATPHSFANDGAEWVRLVGVSVPAMPIEIPGKPLGGFHIP